MKKIVKKYVLNMLVFLARVRLKRLRPYTIGITGSVGKTSAKEAIYTVLKDHYRVIKSEKSYNTDFGLPLAILEQESGFSSPIKWIKAILGAIYNAFIGGKHMQMLVIEMGVDKPGDMDDLLKIVKPQEAVMTNIKPVHLGEGQFKNLEEIFAEKRKLVDSLPEKGVAILNADDPYVSSLIGKIKCKTLTYGLSEQADLKVLEVGSSLEGLNFKLSYKGQEAEVDIPLLGKFQVYVLLPAIAVALTQGLDLHSAVEDIKKFALPPGRMNLIPGIHDTVIIDSSYNASPESMKEALEVLKHGSGRKIAVLGNMNELGHLAEIKHREVGRYADGSADVLVTVGEFAKFIGEESQIESYHFSDAMEAAEFLRKNLQKGDTILVKGSQNKVRLERLVKELMVNRDKASQLLVRQSHEWQKVK